MELTGEDFTAGLKKVGGDWRWPAGAGEVLTSPCLCVLRIRKLFAGKFKSHRTKTSVCIHGWWERWMNVVDQK